MPRFTSGLIMKSSMGISKSAAFRFMLLLHLFLKVKMCVGFADAAAVAVAAGDSDINYDDSDEWLEGKERTRSSWSSSPSPPGPAPASLMRWDGVDSPRSHHPLRMHHVRHEQHYLKHGSVQLPGRMGAIVPSEPSGPYYAHTVTTSTVMGPQRNQQRHNVPDHGHQHHKQQQHQHHQHHHHQHHQHVKTQSRSSGEKRDWYDQFSSQEMSNGLSGARGSRSPQEVVSRKSSTATFRDAPAVSIALPNKSPSADGVSKTSARSMNPHSQKYFEDLLTEYKRRSPYYKELHHQESRSPQTKALATGKGKLRGSSSSDATKKVNAKVTEMDYEDYMYDDDEVDEDVQNDAAYGGDASTSTRAPTTTTTTTTTTTAAPTTTSRSIDSLDGDSDYSARLKQAYSIRTNPARRGNNRYSSMPRQSAPASNNQHSDNDMANQVRDSDEYPPLTRYKLEHYGTPEAVAKSYKKYQPSTHIVEKVVHHIQRVNLEGSCRVPKPKLVPAPSDRNVIYYPQCTILHRCDDSTGCCMDTETCVPKVEVEVELYFYMSRVGAARNKQEVVAVTMTNHTECHCVRKGLKTAVPRAVAHQPVAGFDWDAIGSAETDVPVCNCPEFYKPIFDSGSKCYCDCVSGAKDCMRFKEGHEHFSYLTRKKISSNQFQPPSCEYGTYNRNEGRCPTKSERMDQHFSRYR